MRDHLEKYLEMAELFPNKAGKLRSVLEVQRRLTQELANKAQDDNIKRLLIANAEGYDVAIDLLEWFKTQLTEVMKDVSIVKDGAKTRNALETQSELISFYMDNDETSTFLRARKQ